MAAAPTLVSGWTSGTKPCRSRSLRSPTVDSIVMNASSDPAVERLHAMPVIEPLSTATVRGESEAARSRIGLTIDYLKARRVMVGAMLLAATLAGTALALLLPSKYTARA